MSRSRKSPVLGPEIIGMLAEKGASRARLNNREKEQLLSGGLEDLYAVQGAGLQMIPALDPQTVARCVDRFFGGTLKAETSAPSLWVRLMGTIVETVAINDGWAPGSPAFSYRSPAGQKGVAFHKEIGRITMHLEVIRRDQRLADFRISLTDDTGRERSSFEIELERAGECVESVNVKPNAVVSLSAIELGDYALRLSDAQGELTFLHIRVE